MTPERWRQVTAVFHAARGREPATRGVFLDQACGGDASLRAKVGALLAAEDEASRAGTAALAADLLPQLPPGTRFGPYRIDALVGSGGMGQVYRAIDPRLQRTVAIKVLTPTLTPDAEVEARFEREARLLASLNHPNIAGIHGLETAGDIQGLVLEFVEGPTLADRLARGRLSVPEALGIAKQIAQALESAHEKGIVHRDLKPANVKVTPAQTVKVLDFGIARMAAEVPEAMTAGVTRTGLILGTPAYMSPEQARGLAIDKRTDVFAFGCVLFEMLTGRGAFAAPTGPDSVAKLLEREPDWTALPADVPPPIVRLLKRCLQKDPGDRLRDIGDARIEIAELLASPRPEAVLHDVRAPSRRRVLMAVVIGLAAIAATAFGVWRLMGRPPAASPAPPAAIEFGVMFPDSLQPSFGVAVSPDGRHIATGVFGVAPQIWLHSFDTNETRPLPGTEGGSRPEWSPDSSTISYAGRGQLWKLNIHGGSPVALASSNQSFTGSTWNQDGVILFISEAKLFRVPSTGGATVEVRVSGLTGQPFRPAFLPDGRHFIVTGWNRVRGEVFLASLDSDRATKLLDTDSPAGFAPPDRLLFFRDAALMTQKLDLSRLALSGDAELVSSNLPSGALFGQQQMTPSASATGVLAFPTSRRGSAGHLRWFDRTAKGEATVSSPPDAEYLNPAISPDGSLVAANRVDPQTGRWDIWLVDTTRTVASKLTTDAADDFDPVWSPDGKEIVFASMRGGRLGLYRQSIAGGGGADLLIDLDDSNVVVPTDWSRDGRYILYQRTVVRAWAIWALPLFGDRTPILVLDEPFSPYAPHLSPDGRWLAYNSFESGPAEVFVRRFLADGPKKQISSGGGVHPRWTRDGKELVYWSPPGGIHAHDVSLSASDIRVGPRRTLLDRPVLSLIDGRTHYDITRDGQRLLVRHPAGPQSAGIRVILNWTSKLER